VGWLDRFPGRKSASDPQALAKVLPSDQVEPGGETWTVAAVLFYRDATSEWPVVTVSRVVGPVDVTVGDTLSYQVLRSDTDPRGWLSVEAWPSGFVDVSVGRFWPVDRIVSRQSLNR
jgi:hypothetical protein